MMNNVRSNGIRIHFDDDRTLQDFNTDDDGATLPTDYWFLHSHDDGAAWSESRITTASFDMRDAPFARGLFTGDYEGLAVQDGNFLTLFSQPHGNDPASTYFTSITP